MVRMRKRIHQLDDACCILAQSVSAIGGAAASC
jgi:hypothetical protein